MDLELLCEIASELPQEPQSFKICLLVFSSRAPLVCSFLKNGDFVPVSSFVCYVIYFHVGFHDKTLGIVNNSWKFSLNLLFFPASRNQFHQYYIYGKFKDCSPYKNDMQNCVTYKITKSESAKVCWSGRDGGICLYQMFWRWLLFNSTNF